MNHPKKERLDVLLEEKGIVTSRTKAQALILAGQVRVGGQIVTKVGTRVSAEQKIELVAGPKYVSRGGEKLEGALEDFEIAVAGLHCVDIGSSTGGFTDCLLKKGAKSVVAIDVGKGQLDISLRNDPRVLCLEETHILEVSADRFGTPPELAVIDVSFISLTNILAHVKTLMAPKGVVLAMVKPQFEVGPKFLKKGVVRSEEVQLKAVADIVQFAKQEGFYYFKQTPARIKGPKGNQEYFVYLQL